MKLYKFRSLFPLEFLADLLVSERLYCAKYSHLNDPFEGHFTERMCLEIHGRRIISEMSLDDLIDPEEINDIRVCSLSRNYQDVRMWAHYADGHKGVAIEIDFLKLNPRPKKVTYNKTVKSFDTSSHEYPSIGRALLNKTDKWKYEKEYRILSRSEFFPITGRIRRVILGPLFPKKFYSILQKLCPPDVQLLETKIDLNTARVQLKRDI